MNRSYSFLIICFVLIIISGCNKEPRDMIASDEFGGSGLGLWYSNSDDHQFSHTINYNQNYYPKITVINNLSNEQRYRLFFLLDYKQTNVKKDGKYLSYIDILLKPSERKDFNVEIDKIGEGLHDFIVISIRSPKYHLNENKFIAEDQFFMFRKVTLFAGQSKSIPSINYNNVKSKITKLQSVMPLLSHSSEFTDFKQLSTILSNTEGLFGHVILKNVGQRIAVLLLSTEGQIPLKTTYYKANQPGQIDFPLKMIHNSNIVPYNLYFVVVDSPYSYDINAKREAIVHSSNLISVLRK